MSGTLTVLFTDLGGSTELLAQLGDDATAAQSYRCALELVTTERERRFLLRRLAEVEREPP